jgi:membrane dipeptidase
MNREFPPVFDGHEDFITQMEPRRGRPARDFLALSEFGHVDLPRAMSGSLGGCFTSIYLTDERAEANALSYAVREMNDVFQLADRSEGCFRVCRTVDEVRAAFADGAFASVFMFEGADPISWSLNKLRVFYEAGLRCLAPTWSRSTIFAHGVAFAGSLPESGLTDLGRELVARCNELGIILDVSHINRAGFADMLEASTQPVVATHSNAQAVSAHVRNLDDDQIRALAEQGGTMGINFATAFLRPDMQFDSDTSVEAIVAHFDHVVNLVGDEHVSFGTDFDGAGIPDVVGDAAGLPVVLQALQARGYSDDRLERIYHGNFLRVASAVWR